MFWIIDPTSRTGWSPARGESGRDPGVELQIAGLVANQLALAEQVARFTSERDQYRDPCRRKMEIARQLEQDP